MMPSLWQYSGRKTFPISLWGCWQVLLSDLAALCCFEIFCAFLSEINNALIVLGEFRAIKEEKGRSSSEYEGKQTQTCKQSQTCLKKQKTHIKTDHYNHK